MYASVEASVGGMIQISESIKSIKDSQRVKLYEMRGLLTVPTGMSLVPSGMRILARYPSSEVSRTIVDLSVSISARASPSDMPSPSESQQDWAESGVGMTAVAVLIKLYWARCLAIISQTNSMSVSC